MFSRNRGVDRFLHSDLARRIAVADEIYKEEDFVDFSEKGKQQGIIDLFFIEDGRIVLVDYKTDRHGATNPEHPDIREIVDRYREQLRRYRDVLEKTYQKKVTEVYLYLLHGEGMQIPVTFHSS